MSAQKSKLKISAEVRLSTEEIGLLEPIGKRIRREWDEANCLAARARAAGNDAVKAALLCGEGLLEAKAICGHGRWLRWLERHCGDVARDVVSLKMAQRWMLLAKAKRSGVSFLEAGSLTAAYRMVGILPALEASGCTNTECEKGMTIDVLVGRLSFFRKVQGSLRSAVVGWTGEQRRRLAEELRPLIELYHELIPEAGGAA